MKILFPKANEYLVCHRCGDPVIHDFEFSEDGDLDFPFCDNCLDFVTGIIKEKKEP